MKKILLTSLLLTCFILTGFPQAPFNFNYQAVARDLSGNIMKNTPVKLKISILKTNTNGDVGYSETHLVTTNNIGLINLEIGKGNEKSGSFESIKWGLDKHFIKIEMDKDAGSNYKLLGTSQLLSVPYSLFAGNGVQYDLSLTCNESTEGIIRYNSETKKMEFCDGTSWHPFGSGGSNPNCGESFIDSRDGQVYPTVQIGNQCWMAKNLNYGTYAESIPNSTTQHTDVSNNGVVEKYAFDNDVNNFNAYGGLYDWNEMMNYSNVEGSAGICPSGWHIPTIDEIYELVDMVGGWNTAGQALKIGGSSGFDFELGGTRTAKGQFSELVLGAIWTSTKSASHPDTRANHISFNGSTDNAVKSTDVMFVGKACRCLKN